MNTIDKIKLLEKDMKEYRHYFHKYPETAFEEHNTSKYLVEKLTSFGLEVHQGLAKTGVVATLKVGNSDKKIALRSDMDALDIIENGDLPYKSQNIGKMHGCGHDGHMAMLLGAAQYLSKHQEFDGTVYFVFQPAEEIKGGAKAMIEDGLFDMFNADSVWGMHNFPGIPIGEFALKSGAMMASFDAFEIIVNGMGCHAGMPNLGRDPIVGAAQVINSLQSIVSRNIDPLDAVVISVTQVHGGNTWNVIPKSVTIRGTFRCLKPELQEEVKKRIKKVAESTCSALELRAEVSFNPENPGYPVTLNTKKETDIALDVLQNLVGKNKVDNNPNPSMGAEDFSLMLLERPGALVWIGNGGFEDECVLHNPQYDFNDKALIWGAAYWVDLTNKLLA